MVTVKTVAVIKQIFKMLEPFCVWVGSRPVYDVVHSKTKNRRYTFVELMRGVTPESIEVLNAEIAWSLEGAAMGRELL